MNVISGILSVLRRPGRFELMVDAASFATLTLDTIERLGLVVGRSVAGLEDQISAESAQLKVYDRAVTMLSFRARSSVELTRALVKKGEDPAIVPMAISRLQEQGFLDDASFARSFTRARVVGANHSRRRVQQELFRKGVPRDISASAIDAVFEDEQIDQRALVEKAARRKLRSLAGCEPAVRRRRLYAYLARRGYEHDDIRAAMVLADQEVRSDEDGMQSDVD